jgi:hypothetical protein
MGGPLGLEMGVIIRGLEGGPRIGSGHDQSPLKAFVTLSPASRSDAAVFNPGRVADSLQCQRRPGRATLRPGAFHTFPLPSRLSDQGGRRV